MKNTLTVFALLICIAAALTGCGAGQQGDPRIVFTTGTAVQETADCNPTLMPLSLQVPAVLPHWYSFSDCNLEPEQMKTQEDFELVSCLCIRFPQDYELSVQELKIFPNLQELEIHNAQLRDMESFKDFPRLSYLELEYCELEDLNGIAEMENLRMLNLSGNKLKSLQGVERLTKLQSLDVSGNSIESLNATDELRSIRTLILSGNGLKSLKGIELFSGLEYLDASENYIVSPEPLSKMQLRWLNLKDNPIEALDAIAEMKSLDYLNINDCPVSSLAPLAGMQSLRHLDMCMSAAGEETDLISTLEPLTRIAKLESITIDSRHIPLLRDIQGKSDIKVYLGTDALFGAGHSIDEALALAEDHE